MKGRTYVLTVRQIRKLERKGIEGAMYIWIPDDVSNECHILGANGVVQRTYHVRSVQ